MKLIRYEYPQAPATSAFNRLFDLGAPSFQRFGNLFDDFFGSNAGFGQPSADLYEDDHNYYVRMELPGVKKDTIDLELENAVLTISSAHEAKDKDTEESYSFQRSISVPDGVEVGKVTAAYEDGILTITMPKAEARKPRQITIK
ncbi:Hsp20/alpha crystallin family protein [Coraliomargarita parva]|uniref:Hsp20/alpha crystallin family protein n=1 Tax=Coraliomargarita parva TaxID=3014050 RepID=UPI0022B304BF|nr:Hsp20/alpha crystallin family protein [Coraliomargarita parva]